MYTIFVKDSRECRVLIRGLELKKISILEIFKINWNNNYILNIYREVPITFNLELTLPD